ncbi:MAG: HNH endonuclease [Candidatus Cloacimonetes bacterium]|nr:HNH endonuclease [Candidatus Cloacimonadota bacterium]
MNKTKIERKMVECLCGCRKLIISHDKRGRKMRFAKGHKISKGHYCKRGYKWLSIPGTNKKIQEHRQIIQDAIGRPLKKSEVVHHINGIKDDNRLENLMVMNYNEHNHLHRPLLHIDNEIIECKCGCGIRFNKYDNKGRERVYAPFHAPRKQKNKEILCQQK